MLSKVKSCGLIGIDGYVVEVETDIGSGLPAFDIVGLGDVAVRESRERVKSAVKNSGCEFPIRKITVNLAPANLRKEGSSFDLAIAIGILCASEQVNPEQLDEYLFLGELSLDGEIKPVNGALSVAVCAKEAGFRRLVLSSGNSDEAAVVEGLDVLPARKLSDVIRHLNGNCKLEKQRYTCPDNPRHGIRDLDYSDVKGQAIAKRAMEVAVAGSHNCLLIGSPGSGKTMMARRLPSILPDMTFTEALESTKIHSIAGLLQGRTSLLSARPFRSPHHTVSSASMTGGGKHIKPGEISLAHNGVLFMDELPEFSRDVLEALRQPLEDGVLTVSRVNSSVNYPARVMLVCAANPCRCGNYLDGQKACTCTPRQVQAYMGKLSGPLMDRIDIQVEVTSVKYSELDDTCTGESSEIIRGRVNRAREIQQARYLEYDFFSNSQLPQSLLKKFCCIDTEGRQLLRDAFEKLGLSARAHSRILKVARTIADLEESEKIGVRHIAEAIQYRSLDRRLWEK